MSCESVFVQALSPGDLLVYTEVIRLVLAVELVAIGTFKSHYKLLYLSTDTKNGAVYRASIEYDVNSQFSPNKYVRYVS
jgi:hypothetical protein